jgi:hypothetical protein
LKKGLLFILILVNFSASKAQKIDSIFFNLYTDSLKKGTHNYINLDAKMSDGTWMPLTSKHLDFSTSYGYFDRNDLVLADTPTCEFVKVKAVLKSDTTISRETTIWIKKKPDDEYLPTDEEILREMRKERTKKKKGKS